MDYYRQQMPMTSFPQLPQQMAGQQQGPDQSGYSLFPGLPGFPGQGGLNQRVTQLENRMDRLERQNERLARRISRLERQISYMPSPY